MTFSFFVPMWILQTLGVIAGLALLGFVILGIVSIYTIFRMKVF